MVDLNNAGVVANLPAGVTLWEAYKINDKDQILGFASDGVRQIHFLLY